jgi:hypothetical protein
VIDEDAAAFARYEAALVGNGIDTLNELFWHAWHTSDRQGRAQQGRGAPDPTAAALYGRLPDVGFAAG